MTRFAAAAAIILGAEGPAGNDPRDSGGMTNYGHDQASWPDLLARVQSAVRVQLPQFVSDLSRDQAMLAYEYGYWHPCRCDDLPAPLALVVFDAAVNQGLGWAPAAFQSVLGVRPDGDIGPLTVAAAERCDVLTVLGEFTYRRLLRYRQAGNYAVYGHGWETRAIRTVALADIYDADPALVPVHLPHVGVPQH